MLFRSWTYKVFSFEGKMDIQSGHYTRLKTKKITSTNPPIYASYFSSQNGISLNRLLSVTVQHMHLNARLEDTGISLFSFREHTLEIIYITCPLGPVSVTQQLVYTVCLLFFRHTIDSRSESRRILHETFCPSSTRLRLQGLRGTGEIQCCYNSCPSKSVLTG